MYQHHFDAYAATSTRPDIAFAVNYLCKCLQRPTPELIRETEHVISYLARSSSVGLTYTRGDFRLGRAKQIVVGGGGDDLGSGSGD